MMHHSPGWFMLSSAATADIGLDTLISTSAVTLLAFCMVVLRWYTKVVCKPGYIGADDWLVSVAMLLSFCIAGIIGGEFKLDCQHNSRGERDMSTITVMLKLVFSQSLLYHLSTALVKIAFIIQYLRLFSVLRSITLSCYVLLCVIVISSAWGIFGIIFLCRPTHLYWDIQEDGACMDAEAHFFSTSVIGIALNWAIWVLPIPVIGQLKLPRRQKWSLMCVFGLGGMVCVVGILKLVLVWCYGHQGKVTKSGTFALIWSTLELNVAIICASLLVMKPLFARFVPAIVSDQPVSAREDARLWRALTGLTRLADTETVQVGSGSQKEEDDGRRDTVVAMSFEDTVVLPMPSRAWDPRRGLRVKRRSWLL